MTTTIAEDNAGITKELATGKFTDEMLADMRALIGTELRTEAGVNNEYATRTGDPALLRRHRRRQPAVDRRGLRGKDAHGALIAPPSFIFACLGSVQVGWPGLGGFHAETDDRPSTSTSASATRSPPRGLSTASTARSTATSAAGGSRTTSARSTATSTTSWWPTFICSRMRFERGEMQKRAASRARSSVPHPWTEERARRDRGGQSSPRSRAAPTPRYWDDVQVGDEIDVITKGPLGLTDFIAFIAAGAAPIPRLAAHSVALQRYRKHPKWAFRDPSTHALEPVYSVHYNDYAARLQGAQIAYDVGIQRTCWQIHSLTNWMGDAGALKSITGQYRSHVYLADVVRLGGRVEGKEIDADGDPVVHLTTWARNQREQDVMPGTAVSRCRAAAAQTRSGDAETEDRRHPVKSTSSGHRCRLRDARWGDQIAVEVVNGVPYRMYAERPRRLEDLLAFADRWGDRPHIVQGERVVTFADLRQGRAGQGCRTAGRLGVKRGERVFILGWNSPEWVINFWACLCGRRRAGARQRLVERRRGRERAGAHSSRR